MSITFDVAELGQQLAAAQAHPHRKKLAVVLPLVAGARATAYDLLAEGPPFDLGAAGIDSHEVLLTDSEAIFVFGLRDGPAGLEQILAEEDFWSVVRPWEHLAAAAPRVAHVAYDWHRP